VSPRAKRIAAVLYGIPFVWVGIQHFVNPEVFVPIVPSYLGWPEFWVHITGWTEIALGVAIMLPRFRKPAAALMVAQLVLLYLANLNMWMNDIAFEGHRFGNLWHAGRLVVQGLLIAIALWLRKDPVTETATP